MKKMFLIALMAFVLLSSIFAYNGRWATMNGNANIIKGFLPNLYFAAQNGDLPAVVAPRMEQKWKNLDITLFTVPYGYEFYGTQYYGRVNANTPIVYKGSNIVVITTIKNQDGSIFRVNNAGMPVYCKIVKDTLRYEESPATVEDFVRNNNLGDFINPSSMDLEYTILFFGDGCGGIPQCDNFCIEVKLIAKQPRAIIAPPPPAPPTPVIPRNTIPLRTVVEQPVESVCSNDIELDAWLNTSATFLKYPLPETVISDSLAMYNITRNYDARKSYDAVGGARVTMNINEDWKVSGEIGGGALDGAGFVNAEILFKRNFETRFGNLSLGLGPRNDQWQYSYWTLEKFNIISQNIYSIRMIQHLSWINSFSIAGEARLYNENSYALIRGFVDPKEWNNYVAVEAKTEDRFFGYLLANQQNYRPSEFVDESSIINKPKRTNRLGEVKLGLEIKKTENENSVYCFVDGRLNRQEVQQPRFDGPYLYKYIRSDLGIGIQFPFYTENAQLILTYVDIKDGDWKNHGWCIRFIWNIF